MSTMRDKITARIEKLLKLAKDGQAHEGEVANALTFAHKLMAKHDIEEKDLFLNSSEENLTGKIKTVQVAPLFHGSVWQWAQYLASAIGVATGTRVLYISTKKFTKNGRLNTVKQIAFYGFPNDADAAGQLWMELFTVVKIMSRTYEKTYGMNSNDYRKGFAAGIYFKCLANEKAEAETTAPEGSDESTGTAIVLVKKNALDAYDRAKKFGKIKTKKNVIKDPYAYSQGYRDGESINPTAKKIAG